MATGKKRVVSICLTDLPKSKMTRAGNPPKSYISLTLYDLDVPNYRDQDVQVEVTQTTQEALAGHQPQVIGGGIVHNR